MEICVTEEQRRRAAKYLVFTGNTDADNRSIAQLEILRQSVASSIPNDIAKYNLPESWKTSLVATINARSLRNFLKLRSSSRALWEMQDLATEVYYQLPQEMRFIFEDVVEDATWWCGDTREVDIENARQR